MDGQLCRRRIGQCGVSLNQIKGMVQKSGLFFKKNGIVLQHYPITFSGSLFMP